MIVVCDLNRIQAWGTTRWMGGIVCVVSRPLLSSAYAISNLIEPSCSVDIEPTGLVRLTLNYFLLFRDQGNQLIDIGAVHTLRLPEPANHIDYQEEHEKVLKHFHRAINDSSALLPKQRTPRSQDVAQGRVDIGGGQCLVTIDSVAIRVEAVRQEYFIALVVVRP